MVQLGNVFLYQSYFVFTLIFFSEHFFLPNERDKLLSFPDYDNDPSEILASYAKGPHRDEHRANDFAVDFQKWLRSRVNLTSARNISTFSSGDQPQATNIESGSNEQVRR
jgi:hypothetical protein